LISWPLVLNSAIYSLITKKHASNFVVILHFSEPEALNEEENIDVISQKTNSDSVEIETEETADGKFMMVGDSQENKASKRRDIMSHLEG
jgi:hypothetical protein